MDYKYGNKKQWRRWVWNRITQCVNARRAHGVLRVITKPYSSGTLATPAQFLT